MSLQAFDLLRKIHVRWYCYHLDLLEDSDKEWGWKDGQGLDI